MIRVAPGSLEVRELPALEVIVFEALGVPARSEACVPAQAPRRVDAVWRADEVDRATRVMRPNLEAVGSAQEDIRNER